MKLPADAMRVLIAGMLAAALAGCGARGLDVASAQPVGAARSIDGPAADYPLTVGDPYAIDGVTFTPLDTLNHDEVGYAAADTSGDVGVTAAHHTLPYPSYVEVTALDSGKTALVRVERRGPMASTDVIALSPAALGQLGIAAGAPVRVRRVNPPEEERAELRAGRPAPPRMETPKGLLEVLRRKLPAGGFASLADPRQAQISGRVPSPDAIATLEPNTVPPARPAPTPQAAPTPAIVSPVVASQPAPAARAEVSGDFVIQLGAFSVRANAEALARKVGGYVAPVGKLSAVRTGPYASRGQAEDALAKLKARGYSDARIQTR